MRHTYLKRLVEQSGLSSAAFARGVFSDRKAPAAQHLLWRLTSNRQKITPEFAEQIANFVVSLGQDVVESDNVQESKISTQAFGGLSASSNDAFFLRKIALQKIQIHEMSADILRNRIATGNFQGIENL